MSSKTFPESELILHPDGSIYHLHLKPEQVAETIITVGDPFRVPEVSKHFDTIQHKVAYREFVTHTGYLNNKRLTVISTGIGTDNVDIVFNELDALVNIDFATRQSKKDLTSLDIIRVGTSGSVSEEVDIDTILISEAGLGMDALMNFYDIQNDIWETVYLEAFNNHIRPYFKGLQPYIAKGSESLIKRFEGNYPKGTTITACGFYAPQGRALRAKPEYSNFIEVVNKFRHQHFRITNLEMETAGIYAMGKLLGHNCLSVNAILANRISQTFSKNPGVIIDKMIEEALEIIVS